MAKWLIWTLLEFCTFMILASAFLLWLSSSLKKRLKTQSARQTQAVTSEKQVAERENYKHLVHYLDQQIAFAANAILIVNNNSQYPAPAKINRFKLWGTVLQAERAILLNEVSNNPKPILNRFLSSLLFAVLPSKLKEQKVKDLDRVLKDTGSEFFLMGKRLVTKENLSRSQFMLNEDLRANISRAEKRLEQLKIKKKDQQKLELEISKLQSQIKMLEKQQSQQGDKLALFDLQVPQIALTEKDYSRHPSYKQIDTLNSLSKRQTMIIDQLKNELDRANKNNDHAKATEMKHIALSKMERMCEESQSLMLQLEAELKTSNLTIASLKEDLNDKEIRLAEIEKQLTSKNETASSTLQTLNANKKEALGSLRLGLNTALEQGKSDNLLKQERDTKMLERLLQESETCVTLLVQELGIAEETNEELKKKVDLISADQPHTQLSLHKPLIEQREKNRQLVEIISELKEKLLEQATHSDQQELRIVYNKKGLEYDRLQLAYADLEMKHLASLKNNR